MPAPNKRESELKRPRARKGGDDRPTTIGTRRPVTIPEADPNWHPIALGLYNSARTSGQSDYYQDSDWWTLYSLCEDISYYKKESVQVFQNKKTGEITEYPKPRSGQMLASIMASMKALLMTEGDRLSVRMELQEVEKPKPNLAVVAMDLYRDAADGA